MFNYFKKAKAIEIKVLEKLANNKQMPKPLNIKRIPFSKNLEKKSLEKGLAVIAEYKRASPSLGNINLSVSPAIVAAQYSRAGAAAISVLTEKTKFKGKLQFLKEIYQNYAQEKQLPLLRKDFIFHPLQVEMTASTPASAILLIVKITPSAKILRDLREQAEKYNIEAVVEVLDEEDLKIAKDSGAKIIQINARDFTDLSVDLNRSLNLAKKYFTKNSQEIWIAASGFSKPSELKLAKESGFTAILAGTALMASNNLEKALNNLLSEL